MLIYKFSLFILVIILATSCTKDVAEPAVPCEVLTSSFNSDILPIFTTNCAISGCHNLATSSGGFAWETHAVISANVEYILHVINHEPGYPKMPKNKSKLHDTLIQKIQCWYDNGTPDN